MVLDDKKPITQKTLVAALNDFFEHVLVPRFENVDKRFDKVEKHLDRLEGDLREIKHKITNLQADTPTQAQVDRHEKRLRKLEQH